MSSGENQKSDVISSITSRNTQIDSSSASSEISKSTKSCHQAHSTSSYQHGLSGVASGLISTLVLHPFEVMKIRMQSDATATSHLTLRRLWDISRQAGIYSGLSPNAIASASAWGIFFGVQDKCKLMLYKTFNISYHNNEQRKEQFYADFTSAIIASGVAQLLTSPLWLMKVRMSLNNIPIQSNMMSSSGSSVSSIKGPIKLTIDPNSPYRTLLGGLRHIYSTEGVKGLYKGFGASLLGSTHGAIVLSIYQQLTRPLHTRNKQMVSSSSSSSSPSPLYNDTNINSINTDSISYRIQTVLDKQPKWAKTLFVSSYAAFVSKTIATLITYPTQVIRTSIQDQRYKHTLGRYGIYDASRDIWRASGLMGFYRGISMQILRASLSNMVVFCSYELANTIWHHANTTQTTSSDLNIASIKTKH